MKIFRFTVLVCLVGGLGSLGLAQTANTTITGYVQDSTGSPLEGATTVLLRAEDSVMASFAIAGREGYFVLPNVSPGEYLLQITFVGYGSFQRKILLDGREPKKELGAFRLDIRGVNLEAVIVEAEFIPILIKKDTIEYNADAFKTEPNASVEDLLKKLPGIEVERDGKVKAQGEEVRQVTVDGKEFFGDDPTIATKNLPADIVDKVQVFDRKSDEVEFSGVDDGKDEKTINLALKEGKKQGVFGTVEGAYGTNDRYKGKFNINRFSRKLQLSALGLGNNINEQGFSFNEYLNFMGGLQHLGRGGKIKLDGGAIPLDFGGNQGIARTWAGGINFNYDLGKKTEFRSHYFYSDRHTTIEREIFRNNLLQDGSFDTRSDQTILNQGNSHRGQFRLKHEFDTTQNLALSGDITISDGWLEEMGMEQTLTQSGILQNEANQFYHSEGNNLRWNSSLVYRKRLGKPGRTLVVRGGLGNRLEVAEGALFNTLRYFDSQGNPLPADTTNQLQISETNSLDYNARVTYTEPLGKRHFLRISASRQNYITNNDKSFYDRFVNNLMRNESLSQEFEQNYRSDEAGLSYQYDKDDWNINVGANYLHSRLVGELVDEGNTVARHFHFVLPSLFAQYEFTDYNGLDLYYNTDILEPQIQQLQPVVRNNDPLRLYQGNPNLQPEYIHDLELNYRSLDQFYFRSFFASIRGRYTANRILNVTSIDSLLRQVTTPLNVSREWELSNYLSFSTPLKPLPLKGRIGQRARYRQSPFFINEQQDQVSTLTNNLNVAIENRNKKAVDVAVGVQWKYNQTIYRTNTQLNQTFQDYTLFADLTVELPFSITLTARYDRQTFSQEAFGNNRTINLLHASLAKGFWHKRLTAKLTGRDLLNENLGLDRYSELTYTQEVRTNALGRFFLLSVIYKLSQFGGGGGIQLERM